MKNKIIKRRYYDFNLKKVDWGYFINTGIFANGHLAYSRVTENGESIDFDEEGAYYQIKWFGSLWMEHV